MNTQVNENYINIDEAAEYLGVKPTTVRTWIKEKNLPAHKIGGKLWKLKLSELENWIKNNNCETYKKRGTKING